MQILKTSFNRKTILVFILFAIVIVLIPLLPLQIWIINTMVIVATVIAVPVGAHFIYEGNRKWMDKDLAERIELIDGAGEAHN
ncbi:MAG TPA: hypothetical protein VGQ59_05810 [Cyclobacteriaceae bacterium]|jgi:uncharacterized membrane protein|nr:hypothetical protein [Cyclobacteriaceae bacterium]